MLNKKTLNTRPMQMIILITYFILFYFI